MPSQERQGRATKVLQINARLHVSLMPDVRGIVKVLIHLLARSGLYETHCEAKKQAFPWSGGAMES